MANALYPLYKQGIMTAAASLSLIGGTSATNPYVALVNTIAPNTLYTYSTAHSTYTSVTAGQLAAPGEITTPTVSTGAVFDGNDVVFATVASSVNPISALVVMVANAGANTTWKLVLYEDTSVTGLPITPNGGGVTVQWNASGIFQL